VSGSKLKVQALSFTADSQCPGFPDKQEGSYTLQGALETGWITLSPLEVPDQNAPTSCFNAKFDVQLAGTMMAYGDEGAISLAISLSTITVQGQVVSSGSTSDKCPCSPNCAGKQCGEDGCGGLCGTCQAGQDCQAGKCSCVPQCAGKECGDNGCGGTCGNCPANYACSYGHCTCNASCTGKECGSDGCGGSCGQCPTGKTCVGNKCKSSCTPSCTGKECGPDGCDGTCGECPEGKTCTDGKCTGGTACCPGNCDSAGDCPSPIDPTKSCYCDSACTQYGDCCSDACSACGYGC
jgi:hypothetical protein